MESQFKLPTETVELPSKGLLYPEDSPLSSGKIEMKYMTAKEEDILTNANYLRDGSAVDRLLKSLVVDKSINFKYDGGIKEYVKYLNEGKNLINTNPIFFHGEKNNISIECSLQWTDSYHENTICFTNNIIQRDGGTHLAGFRGCLLYTSDAADE